MKLTRLTAAAIAFIWLMACHDTPLSQSKNPQIAKGDKNNSDGTTENSSSPNSDPDIEVGPIPPPINDPLTPSVPTKPDDEILTGSRTAGDCLSTVYPKTGRRQNMPGKKGIRHYASGKPDQPTWESEYNVDSSWSHYELTAYFILGPGDDTIEFKMYGPTHEEGNKGWYVYGLSNKGSAMCGAEDEHPSDNPKWDCTGGEKTEFGTFNDRRVGLKAAIWTDADGNVTVESYFDDGSKTWVKMASQTNPQGRKFKPQDPQNLLLRADGFDKIKVECAMAQEITPPKK